MQPIKGKIRESCRVPEKDTQEIEHGYPYGIPKGYSIVPSCGRLIRP